PGATCYRDSSGTPKCLTGGGGDPDPDTTTQTTRTTTRTTLTSTSTSTNATSWTSYTTISYETTFGMTFAYTIIVGDETTRTAGIDMPTAIPTPTTALPGITTPAVTSPRVPTPSSNSTSTTSSRAAAFTA
ncbi:hypothetical protein FRC11_008861, partial [Ceratobasidium sp. 423]